MNDKIRKASFVNYEERKTFKYKYITLLKHKTTAKLNHVFHLRHKMIQGLKLKLGIVDWVSAKRDATIWLFDATLEGLLLNYSFHFLLGAEMNIFTPFAYGFAVNELISIVRRLRNDNKGIHEQHKNK